MPCRGYDSLCKALFFSVPNDFSISGERFFNLLRLIFRSAANGFPASCLLFSGAEQNAVFVPENADDFPCPDVHKAVAPVSSSTLS